MSAEEARATPIDWAKVDATSEADIERHAREDDTRAPSERKWQQMMKQGRIRVLVPEQVDVRSIRGNTTQEIAAEDEYIQRNRDAINEALREAYDDIRAGRVHTMGEVRKALARGRRSRKRKS